MTDNTHKMVPGGYGHGVSHCEHCSATEREIAFALGPSCPNAPKKIDTSQLGRICIDPNDDRIRADMVREALRRTDSLIMAEAAELASDAACVALYRMLNP